MGIVPRSDRQCLGWQHLILLGLTTTWLGMARLVCGQTLVLQDKNRAADLVLPDAGKLAQTANQRLQIPPADPAMYDRHTMDVQNTQGALPVFRSFTRDVQQVAAWDGPASDDESPYGDKSKVEATAWSDMFRPTVTINGVFQADAGFFHQDELNRQTVGNAVDGAGFRRARLSARGAVAESVNYFFQMDFGFFGRPTFTDVWLEMTGFPVLGNVRIGQWKQPFSLEVVSSFRYTTFMERSLLFQPFTPFRHIGVGFYDHAEDLSHTWAVSGFRSGQDQFGNSASQSAGWGTAERVTWVSWYDEEIGGRSYMHWGLGHFFATPQNRQINFRTIPEMFIGQHDPIANGNQQPIPGSISGTPFFLQTGNLHVQAFHVFGIEHLWVEGPFSWQTEVMLNVVDQTQGPTVTLPGVYTQVGYFLTGEHRPYDRKTGTIDRVIPYENFCRAGSGTMVCGPGAWEVAFRVSYLDFHAVDNVAFVGAGGSLLDTTLGINWYWNPYTKIVANWVHSFLNHPLNGRSDADSFAFRAQIDF